MGENVDFLKFQRKLNTFLGMPFYVYSTKKLGRRFGEILTAFYRCFTEVIVVVVTIGQLWAVPHVYDNMNVLCGCLSSGSHSFQVLAKTTLLGFSKIKYLTHIDAIHAFQARCEQFEQRFLRKSSGFVSFHKNQTRYINIIVCVQLFVNFMSTSAYFLPFVYDSIVNRDQLRRQLTPIVVYVGVDFNYFPLFQIIVVTLTVGFYTINIKTVVLDNFLLNLILLHMSQLKYQNVLLKEIIQRQTAKGEVDRTMIKGWVRQHQILSSLCSRFQDLISPYLFLEFSYIIIHTCVPSFVITSTFSWTFPQKVAVFCMVGSGLVELFLMSNAGDVFTHAWEETGNVLFQAEYFSKNEKWMRFVYIVMKLKLSKAFRLSALKIVPLSCATFALILRLIFSYYMTLNQIQKMKRNEEFAAEYMTDSKL